MTEELFIDIVIYLLWLAIILSKIKWAYYSNSIKLYNPKNARIKGCVSQSKAVPMSSRRKKEIIYKIH